MRIRAFMTLAFILNIVLWNICLLGSAETVAASEVSSEERMSKNIPMSPFIVECEWVKTYDGWQPAPDSACASGKCVKKSSPEPPCTNALPRETIATSLILSTIDAYVLSIPKNETKPTPTESPPDGPMLRAVVMRR